MTGPAPDWARVMEAVSHELMGDPNPKLSKPARGELRYGNKGALVVNIPPHQRAGQWKDFDTNARGGVVDFVAHIQGATREDAIRWLRERGHLENPSRSPKRYSLPRGNPSQTEGNKKSDHQQALQGESLRRLAKRLWAASQPLSVKEDSPPGLWLAARNLWRPGHPWPANLRWIPAVSLRGGWIVPPEVAGAIVAPLATVDAWREAWPSSPDPVAVHLVAIDAQGQKGWAWQGRDKTRLNLLPDTPPAPVWVIGASPEGLDQVVVVEGVADALGVASRVAATVVSTTNLAAMQGAADNHLGETLSRWDHVMIYADDDRRPDREGAPPGLRGGASLRRAIQAGGGTAEVRHLPGGKDGADWAAANPFLPLDDDAFATYAQTLLEMYPTWPRWEIARRASIETTEESDRDDIP